ncbi:galanin receptor type 2-like [Rhinatrema bivittatum]|uniref:galanin receptor type 2-like n=1 Tax=Rhinatrema bivittatum TaxID=194408 RepID=UPI00112D16C3|nr:galanin receptor type 2-like [Rhinatrema bivittatum]
MEGLQIEPLWQYVALIFAAFFPCFLAASAGMVIFILREPALREKPRFLLLASQVLADTVFLAASTVNGLVVFSTGEVPLMLCALNFLLVVLSLQAGRLMLGAMALDRYLAIRWPLRYPALAAPRRVVTTILGIWGTLGLLVVAYGVSLFSSQRWSFLLAVQNCTWLDAAPVPYTFRKALVGLCMVAGLGAILFSYFSIVLVRSADGALQQLNLKARRTVLFHGLQMALYIFPGLVHQLLEILVQHGRLSLAHVQALGTGSVVVLTLAQCIVPVLYGLRSEEMRVLLQRRLRRVVPVLHRGAWH